MTHENRVPQINLGKGISGNDCLMFLLSQKRENKQICNYLFGYTTGVTYLQEKKCHNGSKCIRLSDQGQDESFTFRILAKSVMAGISFQYSRNRFAEDDDTLENYEGDGICFGTYTEGKITYNLVSLTNHGKIIEGTTTVLTA